MLRAYSQSNIDLVTAVEPSVRRGRGELTNLTTRRNSAQVIIRAAYSISDELGQDVERLIRSSQGARHEDLERLYMEIRERLGEESAKHVYDALANALIPPTDQDSGSSNAIA